MGLYMGMCIGGVTFYSPISFSHFAISMYFILQPVKTMMLYLFYKNNRMKQGPSSLLQWSMTMSLSEGKNCVHLRLFSLQNTPFPVNFTLWMFRAQGTALFSQYVWWVKYEGLEFKFWTCPLLTGWLCLILIYLCLFSCEENEAILISTSRVAVRSKCESESIALGIMPHSQSAQFLLTDYY